MKTENTQIEEIQLYFDQIFNDLLKAAEQGKLLSYPMGQSTRMLAKVDMKLENGYQGKRLFKGVYWSVVGMILFRNSLNMKTC